MPKRQEEQNEEIQDDRIFFKAVPCVLDLATETQGKELLSYASAAEKVQAQNLYDLLKEVARDQGFTVVDRSSFLEGAFGASGSFSLGSTIRVNSYASIENRTSTLVHEMAHALLPQGDPVYDTEVLPIVWLSRTLRGSSRIGRWSPCGVGRFPEGYLSLMPPLVPDQGCDHAKCGRTKRWGAPHILYATGCSSMRLALTVMLLCQ